MLLGHVMLTAVRRTKRRRRNEGSVHIQAASTTPPPFILPISCFCVPAAVYLCRRLRACFAEGGAKRGECLFWAGLCEQRALALASVISEFVPGCPIGHGLISSAIDVGGLGGGVCEDDGRHVSRRGANARCSGSVWSCGLRARSSREARLAQQAHRQPKQGGTGPKGGGWPWAGNAVLAGTPGLVGSQSP